jgi:hypothetical protein
VSAAVAAVFRSLSPGQCAQIEKNEMAAKKTTFFDPVFCRNYLPYTSLLVTTHVSEEKLSRQKKVPPEKNPL